MNPLIRNLAAIILILSLAQSGQSQSICGDSTYRFSIGKAIHDFRPDAQKVTADQGILAAGLSINKVPADTMPFLIKFNALGKISWQKNYETKLSGLRRFQHVQESSSREILLTGTAVATAPDLGFVIIMLKLDAGGNIIWQHRYPFKLQTDLNSIAITDVQVSADGDIYVSATVESSVEPYKSLIFRLQPNGNLVWSKFFMTDDALHDLFGLSIESDHLVVFGRFILGTGMCAINDPQRFSGMKLNLADGSITKQMIYCLTVPHTVAGYFTNPYAFNLTKLKSGYFAISGRQNGLGSTVKKDFITMEFDTELRYIQGKVITTTLPPMGNIRINEDGITFFSMAMVTGNEIFYGVIDHSGKSITQKKITLSPGFEILASPLNATAIGFKKDNSIVFLNRTRTSGDEVVQVFNLPSKSTDSECAGVESDFATISELTVFNSDWNWDHQVPDVILQATSDITEKPLDADLNEICKKVNTCDRVWVNNNDTLCLRGQPVIFSASRNPGCNKRILWAIDPILHANIKELNDTSVSILFNTLPTDGDKLINVKVSLEGCPDINQIMAVTLLDNSRTFGKDTTICRGDTLTLNIGEKYKDYMWQDGSNNSMYKVTQAGRYLLRATSYCGDVTLNAINVSIRESKLSLGEDLFVCNLDTVFLHASGGFSEYEWSGQEPIVRLRDSMVMVVPSGNQTYTVKAKTVEGCLLKDTITLSVKYAPSIHLGQDTMICTNEKMTIRGEHGFIKYLWQDGDTTYTRTISAAGIYIAWATFANGCTSKDTIVITHKPTPEVTFKGREIVCAGQNDLFDVSTPYGTYLWQNGSTNPSLLVTEPGKYWVTVKNDEGCTDSDSVTVNKIVSPPARFITADTVICNLGSIKLTPAIPYESYTWSNGSSAPFVIVKNPGQLNLKVTDSNGCSGNQLITIREIKCVNTVVFPNGFTPDNDGRNDVFKPFVQGQLDQYRLQIFNRWGQKVYESTNQRQGWDGRILGKRQSIGSFVYICVYKIMGDTSKTIRGMITITR